VFVPLIPLLLPELFETEKYKKLSKRKFEPIKIQHNIKILLNKDNIKRLSEKELNQII